MKIDMLESLGYSFLRHVQGCWIVQTNWKASLKGLAERAWEPLEARFAKMRDEFGDDVFTGTKSVRQLLKQAEIDVVGMTAGPTVRVHALEAAFHEGGLLYVRNSADVTVPTVRKKMLRTYLVLEAFARFADHRNIWFVAPKVGPKPAKELEDMFRKLRGAYPKVSWHLRIEQSFRDEILRPTLEAAKGVSDTSEPFVRAERLRRAGSRI